ncbi:MAG: DUF445 family protein [Eubacteriales bacterium]|nr:DUF445 family protein [Eubacteriales bacterium]
MNFIEILRLLSGPLIGAVIGYCTNYIAVKMLFRPLHPVRLFGKQLPFTPGIIPKGQARLAHAIGNVVGTTLLTEEDMQQLLLSEDVERKLRDGIQTMLEENADTQLKDICLKLTDETQYDVGRAVMQEKATDMLADRVNQMHLGETIAQQVLEAVQQKVSGSLIGMMLSGDMLNSFAEPIRAGIDHYLEGNAYALLYPQVGEVLGEAETKSVQELDALLHELTGVQLADAVMKLYQAMVAHKAADMLHMLDLGRVAEEKVLSLQPEELEGLVMSVMKKELGAVVSLGALVGFVLGLLNLFF